MKNLQLSAEVYPFNTENLEELEVLTNPNFYKSGVKNLNINWNSVFDISDAFLKNLSKIKLKQLSIMFYDYLKSEIDYIW